MNTVQLLQTWFINTRVNVATKMKHCSGPLL